MLIIWCMFTIKHNNITGVTTRICLHFFFFPPYLESQILGFSNYPLCSRPRAHNYANVQDFSNSGCNFLILNRVSVRLTDDFEKA